MTLIASLSQLFASASNGMDRETQGSDAGVQGPERREQQSTEQTVESSTPAHRESGDADSTFLEYDMLADAIPLAVFVLDIDRTVRCWNRAAEELTGTPRTDVVGTDEVSVAFYQDGRRAKTLADKVVEAPESADSVFGVTRSTDVDYTRYEDTSTMLDANHEEIAIWFTATPIYRDGTFVGVVEMVQNRSDVDDQSSLSAAVDRTRPPARLDLPASLSRIGLLDRSTPDQRESLSLPSFLRRD